MPVTIHLSPGKTPCAAGGAPTATAPPGLATNPLPPEPGAHAQGVDLQTLAQSAAHKAAAYVAGGAPPVPQRLESQALALEKIQSFSKRLEEADRAGVQLARASFMSKLLGAGICAVGVGVAAALTGVSFGVGAALLAVASVRLAVAVGDAACAYKTYKDACETPPCKTLPLGANSLGNLLHKTVFRGETDGDQRVRKATLASGALIVGLAAAGTALSLGAAAPDVVGRGLRLGCSALLSVMWGRDSHFADRADTASASMRQARREARDAIKTALGAQGTGRSNEQLNALRGAVQKTPELGVYGAQVADLLDEAAGPGRREPLTAVANRAVANGTRDTTYMTLLSGPGIGFLLKALA